MTVCPLETGERDSKHLDLEFNSFSIGMDLETAVQLPRSKPKRRLTWRKQLVFCLVVWLLALVVVSAIGESVLRWERGGITYHLRSVLGIPVPEAMTWAVYDPDLGYRNRAEWHDHNADGMRGRATTPKDSTRYRILLVGDSIGYYGDSAQDTYPGQLETILNSDPKLCPSEILNASTKGYTNYQELVYLKKFGLDLRPDLVLLAVCLNDWHASLHNFTIIDGKIVGASYHFSPQAERSLLPEDLLGRVIRPSLFLTWVWTKGRAAVTSWGLDDGYLFDRLIDVAPAWKANAWPAFEAQFTEISALCRNRGEKLAAVVFPHALQYRRQYLERDRDYVLRPQQQLIRLCENLDIPLLDLYGEFDPSHFLEDQIHLTAAGRTLAAGQIAGFLSESRLIPKCQEDSN